MIRMPMLMLLGTLILAGGTSGSASAAIGDPPRA